MENLPKNWAVDVPLMDLANVYTGKKDANFAVENGKYNFFTCAFEPLKADSFSYEGRVLILPGNGVNVGEVFYYDGKFEAYQRTYIIDEIKVEPKYLFYHLKRYWRERGTSTQFGSATNYIKIGNFKDYSAEVPPLAEQQRIVAKLDDLFGHLEQVKNRLEKIPDLLKNFRQAILTQAVTGKLTEEWRVRKELELPVEQINDHIALDKKVLKNYNSDDRWVTSKNPWKEMPNIPENWKWFTADEIRAEGAEIVYGIVQPGPKLDEGVPYVRGMDIVDGKIMVNQLMKTSEEIAKKYERAALIEGDILLGIIRNTKIATVPRSINGANITQGTARIRPSKFLTGNYLNIVFSSPLIQNWLHSNYRGIDMPGLNLKDVRKTPIPMCSVKEQAEIVSRVESLFAKADVIETKYNTLKAQIDSLPQAILAKAFKGELVEQLPTDGNAKDLLEEIKKLREESMVKKKKKKA